MLVFGKNIEVFSGSSPYAEVSKLEFCHVQKRLAYAASVPMIPEENL